MTTALSSEEWSLQGGWYSNHSETSTRKPDQAAQQVFFFIVLILVNVWSERERDKSTETILAAYTEVQCGS